MSHPLDSINDSGEVTLRDVVQVPEYSTLLVLHLRPCGDLLSGAFPASERCCMFGASGYVPTT